VFVDGLGIGDVNHIVLRDRKQLAGDGMIIVVAQVGRGGQLRKSDIISRGFILIDQQQQLLKEMKNVVRKALADREPRTAPNEQFLRDKVRHTLEQFIFQKTHRQPLILPVIVEV
jgi:ribonuclease J